MDKVNFIRNGVSRLPPGFRFQPTDEELVFQYLKCKIFSSPLPASIIPDLINVSKYDPWDLPPPAGSCNEQQETTYFFSCKEAKYRNSNRMKRTTKCGYWKATGSDKKISCSSNIGLVGLRKTLVFYEGKSPNGTKTDWVLHEYRLVSTIDQPTPNCNSTHQHNYLINEIGDWVLCRLSMKKTSLESDGSTTRGGHRQNNSRLFDFMMVSNSNGNNRSSTSSSCSSSSNNNNNNIEVSSNAQQDHHDETTTGGYICSPF